VIFLNNVLDLLKKLYVLPGLIDDLTDTESDGIIISLSIAHSTQPAQLE
jgi:hypothetical protein